MINDNILANTYIFINNKQANDITPNNYTTYNKYGNFCDTSNSFIILRIGNFFEDATEPVTLPSYPFFIFEFDSNILFSY